MAAVAVLRNETLQAFLQVRARKFTFDDFFTRYSFTRSNRSGFGSSLFPLNLTKNNIEMQ